MDEQQIGLNIEDIEDIEDIDLGKAMKAEKEKEERGKKSVSDIIQNKYEGDEHAWAKHLEEFINSSAQPENKPKKSSKPKKKKNNEGVGEKKEEVESKSKVIAQPEKKHKDKGKTNNKKNNKGVGEEEEGVNRGEESKSKVMEIAPELKSFDVRYRIENLIGGEGLRLYDGTKCSFPHNSTTPVFFVKASPSQINKIDELIEIACNSRYIVTVTNLVDNSTLVVEKGLKNVHSYFERSAGFHSNGSRAAWWTHISQKFTNIFR